MRACSLGGCTSRHYALGYCRAHHHRFKKHGDARKMGRTGRPETPTPTYNSVHRRLHKRRGLARNYECIDCGGPALDWALIVSSPEAPGHFVSPEGFEYSTDLGDYAPFCRRHHVRHDRKPVEP